MAKILQQSTATEKVCKNRANKKDKMGQVVFMLTCHFSTSKKMILTSEYSTKGNIFPVFFVLCFWLSLIVLFPPNKQPRKFNSLKNELMDTEARSDNIMAYRRKDT